MKVGDYVRTKDGTISKIESKRDYTHGDYRGGENDFYLNVNRSYQDYELIIKSSPNIIDLIEVGDYVNGERVKALKGDIESHKINNEDDVIYTEYINDYDEWCGFEEDEIESIVTKKQFEAIQYKVGK